jgi:hypothetical protein
MENQSKEEVIKQLMTYREKVKGVLGGTEKWKGQSVGCLREALQLARGKITLEEFLHVDVVEA